MTEPVITINGRALVAGQVKALRGALMLADGQIDAIYDADRLTEILQIIDGPPSERAKQGAMLTDMHAQRVDRVLQLAGVVPEQASGSVRESAERLVLDGFANDAAAVRLREILVMK